MIPNKAGMKIERLLTRPNSGWDSVLRSDRTMVDPQPQNQDDSTEPMEPRHPEENV